MQTEELRTWIEMYWARYQDEIKDGDMSETAKQLLWDTNYAPIIRRKSAETEKI